MKTADRNGLTLLEVVVTVAIILVMLSLILPAVRNVRGPGYRTQCLNNQRNVAVSLHWYASTNNGDLPPRASYLVRSATDAGYLDVVEGHSWAVDVLPYLDQQGTYDRWDFAQPWNSDATAVGSEVQNRELSNLLIEAFSCPKDPSAFQVQGGLSYVVNCGIGDPSWTTMLGLRQSTQVVSGQHPQAEPFDWNADNTVPPIDTTDTEINRDFMLFWPEFHVAEGPMADATKPNRHKLGELYDGSGNTIMLAENINAGTSPGNTTASWADPQLPSSGFLLPIDATRVSPLIHQADGSLATLVINQPFSPAINAARAVGEGLAPFPNSNHPGVSVFSFCDGSARTINEDIDMQVYARLLTPSGTRLREISGFVSENPIDNAGF